MENQVSGVSNDADESDPARYFFQKIYTSPRWQDLVRNNLPTAIKLPDDKTIGRHRKAAEDSGWTVARLTKPLRLFYEAVFERREFILSEVHNEVSNAIASSFGLASNDLHGLFNQFLVDSHVERTTGKRMQQALPATEQRGTFLVFRRQHDQSRSLLNHELMQSKIVFDYRGKVPWFVHNSTQDPTGQFEEFNHMGPVFCTRSRLYMLAFGAGFIRSWTVAHPDNVRSDLIRGIVLTELAKDMQKIPMAAMTVLIHEDHFLFEVKHGRLKEMLDQIEEALTNPTKLNGVIHAW